MIFHNAQEFVNLNWTYVFHDSSSVSLYPVTNKNGLWGLLIFWTEGVWDVCSLATYLPSGHTSQLCGPHWNHCTFGNHHDYFSWLSVTRIEKNKIKFISKLMQYKFHGRFTLWTKELSQGVVRALIVVALDSGPLRFTPRKKMAEWLWRLQCPEYIC